MTKPEHNLYTLESIAEWHRLARPEPTPHHLSIQLGCHLEEFLEMLESIDLPDMPNTLRDLKDCTQVLSRQLKAGMPVQITNRQEFLDGMADQVVTAIGAMHCAKMRPAGALWEVNRSNWSKFVDGQPVFNAQGKIAKPESYSPPNLEGLY